MNYLKSGAVFIFKKNIYKQNGVMGKKRKIILETMRMSVFLVIIFLFSITFFLKQYKLLIEMYAILILLVGILFFSNVIFGIYKKINKKKYGFRLLNEKEWFKLKNMNVIHYSHILSGHEGEREIIIPAHTSPRVSYLLPKEYREKGFIWFHIADGLNSEEPVLNSFLTAHLLEGDPRKQKVVVKIEKLPKDRLFIDINSGYLLVMEDLSIKAKVYHNFKWYNEKLYLPFIFKVAVNSYLSLFYVFQHQMKIEFEESRYRKKVKKKKEVSI